MRFSFQAKMYIVQMHIAHLELFRQELRLEPRGKPLKDEDTLDGLGIKTGALLYFKALTTWSLLFLQTNKISLFRIEDCRLAGLQSFLQNMLAPFW